MAANGPHLQDVVSRVVTIVADANLRAHVPAAEGAGAELQAADLQQHAGHSGEAVPLQAQLLEPLKPVQSDMAQLTTGQSLRQTCGRDSLSLGMWKCQHPPGTCYRQNRTPGLCFRPEGSRAPWLGPMIACLTCFPGDLGEHPGPRTSAPAGLLFFSQNHS